MQHHHAVHVLPGLEWVQLDLPDGGSGDTIRGEQVRCATADLHEAVQGPAPKSLHRLPALLRGTVDARRLLAVQRVHPVHDTYVRGDGRFLADQVPVVVERNGEQVAEDDGVQGGIVE